MTIRLLFLSISSLLLVLICLFLFWPSQEILPLNLPNIGDYNQSIQQITQEQHQDATLINPLCLSKLMTHGKKTEKVVILFHGYTSCPEQFRALGEKFFQAGYNVYIPRAPHHGLTDRMTSDLSQLTAPSYAHFAQQSIATAQGLGNAITVIGLSGGGVQTVWAAQHLPISKAIIISPALGLHDLPQWATLPTINTTSLLPPLYRWWDTTQKENGSLPYEYPRFSIQGLSQILSLGQASLAYGRTHPPRASRIIFLYNPSDTAISLDKIYQLEKYWQSQTPTTITDYSFPAEWHLPHALVDPTNLDKHATEVLNQILTVSIAN